jgi:hypothetical protein
VNDEEAFEALRDAAAGWTTLFEDVYRQMLYGLAEAPADRRITFEQMQNQDVVRALGAVEGYAWNRAVEALWLDQCFEDGFSYDFPAADGYERRDTRLAR